MAAAEEVAVGATKQVAAPEGVAAGVDLSSVLIVDDAYDLVDPEEHATEMAGFFAGVRSLENPEAVLAEMRVRGLPENPDAFTAESLSALLDADGLSDTLTDLVGRHFEKDKSNRDQARLIEQHLRGKHLNVATAGSSADLPDVSPGIILLDFYLGAGEPDAARTRAVAKLEELEAKYKQQGIPFVVLMSARPVADDQQDKLRDEARWPAGFFDFASKHTLSDVSGLSLRLVHWRMSMPRRHDLLALISAVDGAIRGDAIKEFSRQIRALGLKDYALLQRLQLSEGGEPLGEYLVWLFGSLLAHTVLESQPEVRKAKRRVDAVAFDALVPGAYLPSLAAAKCYRWAITSSLVEPLGPHPLAPAGATNPLLDLGDLLTGTGNVVWMIANASCDLSFKPGGDRDKPERFVALVPGRVVELLAGSSPKSTSPVTTPLYEHTDKQCRIEWDPKLAIFMRRDAVVAWASTQQVQRTAKLRPLYALEIQEAFANQFVRIGTPSHPPLPIPCRTRLLRRADDGSTAIGDEIPGGVTVALNRRDSVFHLSDATITQVLEALRALPDSLEAVAAKPTTHPEKAKKLRERALDVKAKLQDEPKLLEHLAGSAFALPSDQGRPPIIPLKLAKGELPLLSSCVEDLPQVWNDSGPLLFVRIHLEANMAASPASPA